MIGTEIEFWELLTVEELAEKLKVPKTWIYERTRQRTADPLPHLKLGKYVRFEEAAVRAYLARKSLCKTSRSGLV